MPPLRVFTYYVVHFIEKPYPDVEPYVCIPNHWVRTRNPKGLCVLVSYPSKPLPRMEERVRKGSDLLSTWKQYKVEVLYGTYDVDAAESYIEYKLHRRSKRPVEEQSEEELLASLMVKAPAQVKPRNSRLSSTTATEPKAETNTQRTPQTTTRCSTNNEHHKKRRKHEPCTNVDPALINKLTNQIENMYGMLSKYKTAVSDLDTTMNYVSECLSQINSHINSSCNSRNHITAASTQSKLRKEHKLKKKPDSDSEYSSPYEYSDNDIDCVEASSDRDEVSKLDGEPSHNIQLNSKSTLKYRGERQGLIDIGDGVWVNENKLKKCINHAKDQESFTQMLLKLVFNRKALDEALPADIVEKAELDPDNVDIVPNLDDHAMGIIASVAQAHAVHKGWL